MATDYNKNPWKGLKSYEEGEIIYGRHDEIISLSQYIFNNSQTILYGKSGIGKSSILNAGIFPEARAQGLIPVPVRLKHERVEGMGDCPNAAFTKVYLTQIEEAVEAAGLEAKETIAVLDKETESLWEYLHRHTFWTKEGQQISPLFVFDQFEEIFFLQSDEKLKREFFNQLADLLNDVQPQYIVQAISRNYDSQSTILSTEDSRDQERKTSLGAFKGISLNLGRRDNNDEKPHETYLVHPDYHMVFALREDYLSYLESYTAYIPVMKTNRYGLLPINEEEAADIICKPVPGLVSLETATLIIQKVTGRTDFTLDGVPELEVDSAVLSLYMSRLYNKKSSDATELTTELVNEFSSDIIRDFYEESIEDHPERNEPLRNSTVELLEDLLLTHEGRRNNMSRSDLLARGIKPAELQLLINQRRLLRQFSHGDDVRIEFIHDILCPVVRERQSTRLLKKQQERERIAMEAKALKEKRHYQRLIKGGVTAAVVIAIIVALGLIGRYYYRQHVFSVYYSDFTYQNGWPIGVGEKLSAQDAKKRTTSYKLSKIGWQRDHYTFVTVVGNGSEQHLLRNRLSLPLINLEEIISDKQSPEYQMLQRVESSLFFQMIPGNDSLGYAGMQRVFDRQGGNLLYTVNYYREGDAIMAVYQNSEGEMQLRSNGADRMKVILGTNQVDSIYYFYDRYGMPKMNGEGYYGLRLVRDNLNQVVERIGLDPVGRTLKREKYEYNGNEVLISVYDSHNNMLESKLRQYDESGNLISQSQIQGNKVIGKIVNSYDQWGRLTQQNELDEFNDTIRKDLRSYICDTTYQFAEHTIKEPSLERGGKLVNVYFYRQWVDPKTKEHHEKTLDRRGANPTFSHYGISKPSEHFSVYRYYNEAGQPAIDSTKQFHRYTVQTKPLPNGYLAEVTRYYDTNNNLYQGSSDYAIDSCVYDQDHNKIVVVHFSADEDIVKSYKMEYENGREIYRYAMGVDGEPIRCPHWEVDGLNYYKLKCLFQFSSSVLAYVSTEDEYGLPTYLGYGFDKELRRFNAQGDTLHIGQGWKYLQNSEINSTNIPDDAPKVTYVHLLNRNGWAYQKGLKDGDLVVTNLGNRNYSPYRVSGLKSLEEVLQGNSISVLRYNQPESKWEDIKVEIDQGELVSSGAEVYPIYYTIDEYNFFLEGCKSMVNQ